jgi:hypothetical protein
MRIDWFCRQQDAEVQARGGPRPSDVHPIVPQWPIWHAALNQSSRYGTEYTSTQSRHR